MTSVDERESALQRAHEHAVGRLASLDDRLVPPQASVDEIVARLGSELPDGPSAPSEVVDLLAEACDPGLTAMPSGRFYGMVIGGSHFEEAVEVAHRHGAWVHVDGAFGLFAAASARVRVVRQ